MQSNSNPILSIILPVYNAEKYVSQAVESILNQTFKDFELIIADDGSSDRSKEIVNGYKNVDARIILSHNAQNLGKVETCNRLLTGCQGQFITIHDADDWSKKDRFEKQVTFLIEHPHFAMCGCSFYNLDKNDRIRETVIMPPKVSIDQKDFFMKSHFHGPTMVMRMDVLTQVGGLYRYFRNKEDIDLAVRLLEKFEATNLQEPLYYYRNIPSSLSKSGYNFLKFEGLHLIQILHEERVKNGADCLQKQDMITFHKHLKDLEAPYINDASLFFRKAASISLYHKFHANAVLQALQSIWANPLESKNYRTFIYTLRKGLASIFQFQ